MTTQVQDRIHDRRELTAALLRALERRHEVLDAIVDSKDHAEALTTVAGLLDTSEAYAEAVLNLTFRRLTKEERLRIQSELEDLDAKLEWTASDRPASTGRNFRLRPFTPTDEDAELFRRRCAEQEEDGTPWSQERIEKERAEGLKRIDDESAAWFVCEDTAENTSVGLVFGELTGREVDVAIWVAPECRKKGYGTAAVKHSRQELAAEFPGTVLVVRAPA
ncbi:MULTISPECIES: GNAT family N-acetyltransferase [Rhodococcus]|jgi:RimJ/RimL family protein N-acetyltransferase|uniref:GNAT family N-acetyltransferase n=1 Tax=Rhodococcus oxybenzonivorans TaxID=1990687 RepID=A0AAE4V0W7_9NOCA|nr:MULTISPECIES: GNAT family N-acetyltransferase [Rhodococcus]MDV7241060.1 GNAT family N-acetyltransferase [Rhodococcus oxybenzonivorans]MDV7266247.1 GNAT family N-acetyltransferase [Rhodococcus oxybenzonivorans]MDV7273333.1 GNAT family N-acetyltransferase [Rhodococcus oxybenzonivorans]MDV7332929.1 GNAT family N-acetyltransferase [Rhodococcus oxybenzonivorans]MDV7342095.1 GNAT family N-acetyltransferase [Rhodococcus oxybenzonivorans]